MFISPAKLNLPVTASPAHFQGGGEVRTDYASRVKDILQRRLLGSDINSSEADTTDDNPSYEESQAWTAEDWARWRKAHPRFEATPSPTPFRGGGRVMRTQEAPWSEPSPIPANNVGTFGGTDQNPRFWYNPTTGGEGSFDRSGGNFGGRGGPWGSFNPMGGSQTDQSLYGRHWLDKMLQANHPRGRPGQGLVEGGEVTGGSGHTDDVPAMLSGSSPESPIPEFVLNKGAVLNLGLDFLNSANDKGLANLDIPKAPPKPTGMFQGGVAGGGSHDLHASNHTNVGFGTQPTFGFPFQGPTQIPTHWRDRFDTGFAVPEAVGMGQGGLEGYGPMGDSWTGASFYGRHWLDKMLQANHPRGQQGQGL